MPEDHGAERALRVGRGLERPHVDGDSGRARVRGGGVGELGPAHLEAPGAEVLEDEPSTAAHVEHPPWRGEPRDDGCAPPSEDANERLHERVEADVPRAVVGPRIEGTDLLVPEDGRRPPEPAAPAPYDEELGSGRDTTSAERARGGTAADGTRRLPAHRGAREAERSTAIASSRSWRAAVSWGSSSTTRSSALS